MARQVGPVPPSDLVMASEGIGDHLRVQLQKGWLTAQVLQARGWTSKAWRSPVRAPDCLQAPTEL